MPQLEVPFNALQFDPTQGSGVLPVGKHPVIIEASEIRPTKENDGSAYLQFQLKITDGPFTADCRYCFKAIVCNLPRYGRL
jgi:hypothetical protein